MCPRAVPKGRADRDQNWKTPHARRSACRYRRDAGWLGKRGPHRPPAVPLRCLHHALRPWPFAGGGSGRVSRPPGRRPSSCVPMRQHSCHSAAAWSAAGAPADGGGRRAERPRACRVATGAIRRLPRCAAPSTSNWHTRHASLPVAAANTAGAPSLRRWLAGERRRRRSTPPAATPPVRPTPSAPTHTRALGAIWASGAAGERPRRR